MIQSLLDWFGDYRERSVASRIPDHYRGTQIRIRPIRATDIDALAAYGILPEVNEFVPVPTLSREDVEEYVSSALHLHRAVPRLFYGFMIEHLDTKEIVGDCSLSVHLDDRSAEIGYQVAPGHWGRGYATEATNCMLDCARTLRCQWAWTRVYAENRASVRVLEKCGFEIADRYEVDVRQGRVWMYGMSRTL